MPESLINPLLLDTFKKLGIQVVHTQHEPTPTVEDTKRIREGIPGAHCKNLFLKNKKDQYFLIVMQADDPINIKVFEKVIGSSRLSFASPERLQQVLKVTPGSVTPFALINDTGKQVHVFLQADMMAHELLNFHPLRNDLTTTIRSDDLKRFIEHTGHRCESVSL
jgi:Ala-tRNA(Pro) deacylase